jgi:hypothetical protein
MKKKLARLKHEYTVLDNDAVAQIIDPDAEGLRIIQSTFSKVTELLTSSDDDFLNQAGHMFHKFKKGYDKYIDKTTQSSKMGI